MLTDVCLNKFLLGKHVIFALAKLIENVKNDFIPSNDQLLSGNRLFSFRLSNVKIKQYTILCLGRIIVKIG
jgi:hypothetical protein